MSDLAVAYAMKRRAKMPMKPMSEMKIDDGGEVKDEMCMHCGGKMMAAGGMVSEGKEMPESSTRLDMDSQQMKFDEENAPEDEQVLNEMDDPDSAFDMDEEEAKKQVKPSGMLLSRILGGLRKAHSGKA